MPPVAAAVCADIRAARRGLIHQPLGHFLRIYPLTIAPLAVALASVAAWPSVWTYLACALVAGFTQNALGILTHESAHYFIDRRKAVNDRLANLLICMPIFNTVGGYRVEHFEHHRTCCANADPYFGLYGPYATRAQLRLAFLRDLTGITALQTFVLRYAHSPRSPKPAGFALPLALTQFVIFTIFDLVTGHWWAYFLLWVAPLAIVPFAVNRVRTFVEHHAEPGGPDANRTTTPTWFEYFTIAPYGYAHHFEHHLLPDVPYYQLGWAHEELGRRGFTFGDEHAAPSGYLATFGLLYRQLA